MNLRGGVGRWMRYVVIRTSCSFLAPMSFQGGPSNIDATKFYARNFRISSTGKAVEIVLEVAS